MWGRSTSAATTTSPRSTAPAGSIPCFPRPDRAVPFLPPPVPFRRKLHERRTTKQPARLLDREGVREGPFPRDSQRAGGLPRARGPHGRHPAAPQFEGSRGRGLQAHPPRPRHREAGREDHVPRRSGAGGNLRGAKHPRAGARGGARHRVPKHPLPLRPRGDLGHRGTRGLPAGDPEPGELRGDLRRAARPPARGRRCADHHDRRLALSPGQAPMARVILPAVALIPAALSAAEYRALGERPAVLYDAPSVKADRLFVASRYYPFEVLVKLDQWTQVRDANREVAWVENKALGERQTVLVSVPLADVRAAPSAQAPPA